MRIWFENPEWLLLLLAVPVVVGVPLLVRSLAGLSGVRRWMALTLRALVMALLILCLAGLHWSNSTRSVSVVYLLDRSDSVPANLKAGAEKFLTDSKKLMVKDQDKAGVIAFGGKASIEQVPVPGEYTTPVKDAQVKPEQTDLAEAIRMAAAVFPPDSSKRIVILSDGNQTVGDAEAEAKRVAQAGIGIDVVPLDYVYDHEVQVTNLWAPPTARVGDEIPLKISIFSQTAVEGDLILKDGDKPITLDPANSRDAARVKLQPGKNALVQHIRMDPGANIHRFNVEFRPLNKTDDSIAQNNTASAFTAVTGTGKVLVLSTDQEDDQKLIEALQQEKIQVEHLPAEAIPTQLEEYQSYSAVVLCNTPAELVAQPVQDALVSYVKDLGGGLIMTGGANSFGPGGWIGSPVEKIMPVDFEVKSKRQMPRGALVLVMHNSEMPNGNWWGIQIAKAAADALTRLDYIGVTHYDNGVGEAWVVPMQLASNKTRIRNLIDTMVMGDMVSFDRSVQMAVTGLNATDAVLKHIIIVSDGDPAPPSSGLMSTIQKSKITVSTVGIGMGSHIVASTLQGIASQTGGRYYQPNNPNDLPQIFVKEARTITRALIYEKPFDVPVLAYSDVTKGLSQGTIPRLDGLVLTTPKPLSEQLLGAKTDQGVDPLLARWQVGLGRTVVFTSGMWQRWGPRWLSWDQYNPRWAQIVRWAMRKSGTTDLDIQASIEEGSGKIVIDAVDKTAGYINFLEFAGNVVSPELKAKPLEIVQTGPGHYEARFDADSAGSYIIGLQYKKGGDIGFVQTGVASSYSPEYASLQANPMFLETLAKLGNGQVLPVAFDPEKINVFRRDLPEAVTREPAWPSVMALALALFLLDVAVRRIAIDPMAVLAGARGWLGDLAGRWRTQQEKETIGSLKQRREQVQEEWRQRLKQTAPAAGAPDPQRKKFEQVAAAGQSHSQDDFVDELGASRKGADKPAAPGRKGGPEDEGSATSRLLQAKKRAQQKIQEDQKDS